MTAYLKERLCKGFPPHRLIVAGAFVRDSLVSRMMLDRKLIRLVCAPSGMGKTTLVYMYAQIVFSFEGVLWIDAFHPCVLRDLDNGSLAVKMREVVSPGSLVVFEDVPWFGSVRKQRFASVCEDLIAYGCEVVVTASPSCDPFAGDWQDCLVIASQDLLYSDAEFEEMRMKGSLSLQMRAPKNLLERIPGVRDRSTAAIERFLGAQLAESRSSLESALTMAVALLGSGRIDELADILGVAVTADDLRVGDLRPYVELREFRDEFSAEGFPVGDAVRAVQPYLKSVCSVLPGSDAELFLCRIADTLLRHGCHERATKIVMGGCSPASRAVWLARNQEDLLETANPFSVLVTYRSLGKSSAARHPLLHFGHAWALCQLGDIQTGVEKLLAVARRRDCKPRDRLLAATLGVLYSHQDPMHVPLGDSFGQCCMFLRDENEGRDCLAAVWNALLEGDTGMIVLNDFGDDEVCTSGWMLAAACCLRSVGMAMQGEGLDKAETELLASFVERVTQVVERCIEYGTLEITLSLVATELARLDAWKGEWSKKAAFCFACLESKLAKQQGAYGKLREAVPSEQEQRYMPRVIEREGVSSEIPVAPLLEVKLFGGFEVSIGGHIVDAEKTSRLKVRALLALLVLNAGKDLSCEHLAQLLWPDSAEGKARRNFYSIYSMLNRALATPEGETPYLSRTQGVCRLGTANLRSDAIDLVETCNQMRFGKPASEDAFLLLEQLRFTYRGELLPGETAVPAIESARSQWRNRVVDSVIYAARDLQTRGEVAAALEYAKQAVAFDPHREDCYELLMVLQMTYAQRTGAIETYFTYTKMNRELGLGASTRMMDLYNCIISDEPLRNERIVREPLYA